MKLSKKDFEGTGKVFRFTLAAHLKNKANIVSLIILVVFALISVPLLNLFGGTTGGMIEQRSMLETVLVVNHTDLAISEDDFSGDPYFEDTRFILSESDPVSETREAVGTADTTAVIDVRQDGEG